MAAEAAPGRTSRLAGSTIRFGVARPAGAPVTPPGGPTPSCGARRGPGRHPQPGDDRGQDSVLSREEADLPGINRFSNGVTSDLAAVTAGLTLPFSSQHLGQRREATPRDTDQRR